MLCSAEIFYKVTICRLQIANNNECKAANEPTNEPASEQIRWIWYYKSRCAVASWASFFSSSSSFRSFLLLFARTFALVSLCAMFVREIEHVFMLTEVYQICFPTKKYIDPHICWHRLKSFFSSCSYNRVLLLSLSICAQIFDSTIFTANECGAAYPNAPKKSTVMNFAHHIP